MYCKNWHISKCHTILYALYWRVYLSKYILGKLLNILIKKFLFETLIGSRSGQVLGTASSRDPVPQPLPARRPPQPPRREQQRPRRLLRHQRLRSGLPGMHITIELISHIFTVGKAVRS